MKKTLYTLGDIVHVLQKERGCASIFLCSEGKLFSDRMQRQFVESDAALDFFAKGFKRWEELTDLKSTQLQKLHYILNTCRELPELREEILAQRISISKIIDHYTHKIISPMLQVMVEIALYTKDNDPTLVSAYNAFLQWKERIGLERAIGVRGFVGYSFHNQEFLERILFLLSEQGNYRSTYMALASSKQKQLVQEVLEGKAYAELEKLHDALKKSPESAELYELTPAKWFDLVTAKIDALHSVEKRLVDTLSNSIPDEKCRKEGAVKMTEPSNDSGNSVSESSNLNDNYLDRFGEYRELIRSLQLFSGISPKDLEELLQHGQIREYHKGKLLFLEGEQANRLYIILKGWVKIFKGNAAGEETILQMLSSGDAIMESAVFLNSSFPVSAQIAEDATLLSIPAPMIREQTRNNNELALNLLTSMSCRSQGLIRQIEDARLKSVDERIGWFLLRLLLEQGRVSRCIKLPYDKSMIASYLDMKRETFSRSLKRFKAKGFKIENDTIIIPELTSLCGYCDPTIAADCPRNNTPNCPNPQFTDPQSEY